MFLIFIKANIIEHHIAKQEMKVDFQRIQSFRYDFK